MRMTNILTIIMAFALSGCASSCSEDSDVSLPDFCENSTPTPDLTPSLVINDPAVISLADFSLERTIDTILTSEGIVTSAANREAFLDGLISSYNNTSNVNPENGETMPMQVRSAEAGLSASALLDESNVDGMKPVALFNRFDLAPADWENCGEHRIVYSKNTNNIRKFFLIFEASLPNPRHANNAPSSSDVAPGFEGCRPALDVWTSMTGLTDQQRMDALENFYYDGLDADNDPATVNFEAVVHSEHYGFFGGQVRSNHFLQGPWQLREWHSDIDSGTGNLVLAPRTTKDSVFMGFYDDTVNPGAGQLRTAMSTSIIDQLVSNDSLPASEFLTSFGAQIDNKFNEFQSDANPNDEPAFHASANMKAEITTKLTADHSALGLSDEHILNRLGVLTCGGCHQFSGGKALGPNAGQSWPPKNKPFVHVDTDGSLSNVLTDLLLPARATALESRMCIDDTASLVSPYVQYAAQDAAQGGRSVAQRKQAMRALKNEVKELRERKSQIKALQIDDKERQAMEVRMRREMRGKAAQIKELSRELREIEREKPGTVNKFRRTH